VSAQSIIEVEDLTIGYASDGHDTVVLEDVSFGCCGRSVRDPGRIGLG